MVKGLLSCLRRQDSSTDPLRPRKMVIVGDGECGKTCLVTRMATGTFEDRPYEPTVFDSQVIDVNMGEDMVKLFVNDTAGQEDYDRLRPMFYHDVEVVVLCFSLAAPSTLINVQERWDPEIKYYCGNVPVILVGNKKDLREAPEPSSGNSTTSMSPRSSLGSPSDTRETIKDILQKQEGERDVREPFIRNSSSRRSVPLRSSFCSEEGLGKSLFQASPDEVRLRLQHEGEIALIDETGMVIQKAGVSVARAIGALAYFETSALTGENVDELLLATTKAAVFGAKKSRKHKAFAETLKT